jgi:hypothetical protein
MYMKQVRGNGHNVGSPEGTTTRPQGELGIFFTTATDRDLFGLKIWDRCCVIRGESCHRKPPPDLPMGPSQGARQLTALSSSNAV